VHFDRGHRQAQHIQLLIHKFMLVFDGFSDLEESGLHP
jgi:hypothetical protein